MNYIFILCSIFCSVNLSQTLSNEKWPGTGAENYMAYHRTIAQAQERIAHQEYQEALDLYRQVIGTYSFVFLKEYKVAAQLAFQVGRQQEALTYLEKAMVAGWALDQIKKVKFLSELQRNPQWKGLRSSGIPFERSRKRGRKANCKAWSNACLTRINKKHF